MKQAIFRTQQRGLSMMQAIFLLAVIGLVVTVTLKLLPIYQENMGVMRSVKQISTMPDVANMSAAEFKKELENQLYLNDISTITQKNMDEHIQLKKTTEGKIIAVEYNREAHFASNVYLLVKFKAEQPL